MKKQKLPSSKTQEVIGLIDQDIKLELQKKLQSSNILMSVNLCKDNTVHEIMIRMMFII